MNSYQITSIGHIISPYKEKFAVPRQPGLVQDGVGQLILHTPYNHPDAVRGLEQFSHLWLLFIFHQTAQQGWHPLVRPPRLGGNSKLGVFATRSTFRPNAIGMSLVELKDIIIEKQSVILQLGSLDLIDGTPIIDIKPYLPYAESIADATAGFAQYAPHEEMEILFLKMPHSSYNITLINILILCDLSLKYCNKIRVLLIKKANKVIEYMPCIYWILIFVGKSMGSKHLFLV